MFELIHAERAQFPIAFSCRVLEVSRAGYYAWLQRGPSMRSQEDLRLLAEILSIHKEHKGRYGSPRIHQELVHRGFDVGQNRVARLMAENGKNTIYLVALPSDVGPGDTVRSWAHCLTHGEYIDFLAV